MKTIKLVVIIVIIRVLITETMKDYSFIHFLES